AASAGIATLDVYEEEGLFQRAAALAPLWEQAVHSLRGVPNVIDVRNLGLVAGVELEPRPGKPGARGYETLVEAFRSGLLARVTGDIVALSPSLITQEPETHKLIELPAGVIRRIP